MTKLRKYLYLPALLYRLVISLRNRLFDAGILKERKFGVPIIAVGNITAGGTGKTPHTEYLIRLLKSHYRVAVLSRGYKRKTSGFVLADEKCTPKIIGDEPYQLYRKFPDILVAVDENRRRGIETLLNMEKEKAPEVIILDDAFQHRYVKPGLSILLSDFNRPIYEDALLPVGLLREPLKGKERADIVIVTKCPEMINPVEARMVERNLNLFPDQKLFFTSFRYGNLKALFPGAGQNDIELGSLAKNTTVLLVTGIASPRPVADKIKSLGCRLEHLIYPDHYWYTKSDWNMVREKFSGIKSEKKIVMVTEKDAVRWIDCNFDDGDFKKNIYYLPIEVYFLQQKENEFDHLIREYVRAN
ncbi:MAG: tetraacyldisaccharide 4'-kinase [Candidatus Azobacteroides sp.]|nr:tetraacyldisaccharide 4'-kinase [Candidatus Azobacteroides sp.]